MKVFFSKLCQDISNLNVNTQDDNMPFATKWHETTL